jgi:hypothetical protein
VGHRSLEGSPPGLGGVGGFGNEAGGKGAKRSGEGTSAGGGHV